MLAVLGVSQLISSYFDLRARRMDRLENESNAERRHREMMEERREEHAREEERRREEHAREEERRREEHAREEERRREERAQEEERRREERERRRQEEEHRREELAQAEERRRQEEERRHQEFMVLLAAAVNSGRNQDDSRDELIRTLQQTVAELQEENARLRQPGFEPGSDTGAAP